MDKPLIDAELHPLRITLQPIHSETHLIYSFVLDSVDNVSGSDKTNGRHPRVLASAEEKARTCKPHLLVGHLHADECDTFPEFVANNHKTNLTVSELLGGSIPEKPGAVYLSESERRAWWELAPSRAWNCISAQRAWRGAPLCAFSPRDLSWFRYVCYPNIFNFSSAPSELPEALQASGESV